MDTVPDNVINKSLYLRAKKEADEKYKRPGLYKSAWLVKRYVELGGKYSGTKPKNTGVNRWLKSESWVQVIPFITKGEKIQCGSSQGEMIACRPSIRATIDTPITIQECLEKHGKKKVLELARYKEKNPDSRINWVSGTVSP
jgi:hypothetical protein